jgi:hypothetical protein
MLALSLSLGANSVFAQQGVKMSADYAASNSQFSSCTSCRHWGSGSAFAISPWQKVMFVLSAVYIL